MKNVQKESVLAPPAAAAPVEAMYAAVPRERIEIVDMLRGFALGGILLVNMWDFHSPVNYVSLDLIWPAPLDRVVLWLSAVFVTGKFFSLFSFLFGLGFAIQMGRLEARGVPLIPVYLRRQSILLLIGIFHGVFFWYGDVLAPYAIYGTTLLFFRKRSSALILTCAAILILLPTGVSTVRFMWKGADSQIQFNDKPRPGKDEQTTVDRVVGIYSRGSYTAIMEQRIQELGASYHMWMSRSFGSTIFAMFLLGLWAGRRRIFENLPAHARLMKIVWKTGLAFLAVEVVFAMMTAAGGSDSPYGLRLSAYEFDKVSRVAICLFYVTSLAWLWQRVRWRKLLKPLAAPGRMALTNYLLQSIVCTTLFNGYGFGLYGRISPVWGLVLALVLFFLQIVLSLWYLKRYRFGPMEWLWKSLTYRKWHSAKIAVGAA